MDFIINYNCRHLIIFVQNQRIFENSYRVVHKNMIFRYRTRYKLHYIIFNIILLKQ